jgi:predicted transcriptional regulator
MRSRQSFLYPQEIEVFYIIPGLKRELATAFKEEGKKQKDIAKLLHTKEATISQYLHNKRGSHIQFPATFKREVRKSVAKIHDEISLLRETQHLLKYIRVSGVLCQAHKQFSPVPSKCHVGLTGCFSE